MTLIGNHYRQGSSPSTNNLGTASPGAMDRMHAYQPGKVRGFYVGQACAPAVQVQSFPPGYTHPGAWFLSPKAGGISARPTFDLTAGNLILAGGINVDGSTTLTFSVPNADLQLVVSATGTATITWTTTGDMAGALQATGTTSFTFTPSAALLGALAGLTASGQITITGDALIRATGVLAGDITPFTTLSPENLAAAVWNALAASFNETGSFGEILNSGGSGLTAQQVRDALKLAPTAGVPATDSIDSDLDKIKNLAGLIPATL